MQRPFECYINIGLTTKSSILRKIIRRILRIFYSMELPDKAMPHIDKSVEFVHDGLGVVINNDVYIEKNCRIFHNVTIGERKHYSGGALHILNIMFLLDAMQLFLVL